MDDLISRQAAIDAILAVTGNSSVRELYEHVQEHGLSDMWSGGVNAAIDIIIAVPSAQPEVIRCKDCKHRPTPTRADEGITYGFSVEFPDEKCPCQCEDGWYNWYPKNDFYCGYAERREE